MTTPAPFSGRGAHPAKIRCPLCLYQFEPDLQTLYERGPAGEERLMALPSGIDDFQRGELTRNALVLCPSKRFREPGAHFLPLGFVQYKAPIVIGLVGMRNTGKSTLLARMIHEVDSRNALRDYKLAATPLVQTQHEQFRKEYVEALVANGRTLNQTRAAAEGVDFVNGLLLIKEGETPQPVIFFDVGGESYTIAEDRLTRFIQAFNAIVFVVDPDLLTGDDADADRTFKIVADRLRSSSTGGEQYLDKPAAIVLAKADKVRFEPAVARWLTRPEERGQVDPDRVRDESRDIFAFLNQRNASWALMPFDTFRRCTLHAASATGSNAAKPEQPANGSTVPATYSRPLRSQRVIEPLVAILAMAGAIKTPGADRVGR
jgi:GTPase SAR1 family protein